MTLVRRFYDNNFESVIITNGYFLVEKI